MQLSAPTKRSVELHGSSSDAMFRFAFYFTWPAETCQHRARAVSFFAKKLPPNMGGHGNARKGPPAPSGTLLHARPCTTRG